MRLATSIVSDTLAGSAALAKAAEAAGYDAAITMENRHEPFLPLAVAALATERIELATSVAIAFARSPMVVAETAHDLHASSGGRFVLGLGTQVKGHNERRFSVPWSAPAPRLGEYISALRAIWRSWEHDEPLAFEGEHYRFTLMPPNFKPPPTGLGPIPITIAAVGHAMLRLAGRLCDGVRLHPFCTRTYIERDVMPALDKGLGGEGRRREHFEISGGGFVATGPDDATVARMVEFVRYRVAFYGSTRTYFPVWAAHDLEDLGHKLHRMSVEGAWDRMAAEIPDDVVRLFAAIGRHDEIVDAIEARFAGLVDTIAVTTDERGEGELLPPELIQDIRRIPMRFRGFAP
ncbi:MAG: TIGR03617 family F420-dependent LLM class oxidoreductase [Gammaproteobacteria bacterium]|nr:TIGR03617 family F420-dependent LLM class oxidoreductase [Gammaproteobacteria bacterium]